MTKCKSADRYKAVRPPRCNGPCDACARKWATAQLAKIEAALGNRDWRGRVAGPGTQWRDPGKPPKGWKPPGAERRVTPMHDGHLLAAMFNDSFGVIQ